MDGEWVEAKGAVQKKRGKMSETCQRSRGDCNHEVMISPEDVPSLRVNVKQLNAIKAVECVEALSLSCTLVLTCSIAHSLPLS